MAGFGQKMSTFRDKMKQKVLGDEQASNLAAPPPQASSSGGGSSPLAISQRAIDTYLMSKQSNGEIGGIGWWQTANGYTAVAMHDVWSGSRQNVPVLTQAIRQCEHHKRHLINEFNDDTLWWGLCCFHVYTLSNDRWFLDQALAVWDHIVRSNSICRPGQANFQGQDMAGACFWTTKRGEEQINAVTTGLFAELSLRIASVDQALIPNPRNSYIDAAQNAHGWIIRCRYRREDAIVLDHILLQEQRAEDWTFTYTTGVAIGVCALLYQATNQEQHLLAACEMARRAMTRESWVESNGVLTERGTYGKDNHQASQNDDAVGFKAILVRYLATLYSVISHAGTVSGEAQETATSIKSFLQVNFRALQERNTNGNGQYGPWWNGPFDQPTSHSQMAALDVMAVAALIQ